MALDTDTKDFLLHLYDKLWENMGAKEGRLWNYLSIYGAAVALALVWSFALFRPDVIPQAASGRRPEVTGSPSSL